MPIKKYLVLNHEKYFSDSPTINGCQSKRLMFTLSVTFLIKLFQEILFSFL